MKSFTFKNNLLKIIIINAHDVRKILVCFCVFSLLKKTVWTKKKVY